MGPDEVDINEPLDKGELNDKFNVYNARRSFLSSLMYRRHIANTGIYTTEAVSSNTG